MDWMAALLAIHAKPGGRTGAPTEALVGLHPMGSVFTWILSPEAGREGRPGAMALGNSAVTAPLPGARDGEGQRWRKLCYE